MKMNFWFFAAFLSVLFISISFAQEGIESVKPNHTFNLYFINGYAISYNFLNTESLYLRVQLDLSTSKEDIDSEGESITQSRFLLEKHSRSGKNETDFFSIGASAHIIYPVYKTNFGEIYIGTGPLFNYSNSNYNYSDSYTQYYPDSNAVQFTNKYTNTSKEKNYDAGVVLLFGIETFITKNISLIAEANLKGGRRWKTTEWEYSSSQNPDYYTKQTTNSDGNGWFYEAQFIRLGVSVSI